MSSVIAWAVFQWRVVKAVAVRDFKIRITYVPWIINSLVQPVVWTLLLVYTYNAVLASSSRLASYGWGDDYIGFLVLGQVVLSFFNSINWRSGMAIQRERWYGTLEMVFLTPASRLAMLFGSSLFGLIDAGWVTFLAALAVIAVTGAEFSVVDPLAALASIVLAAYAAVAMGIGLAGLYVLTRSAGPMAVAIQHPLRFFTGASFPLSALPQTLLYVSYAIPLTYGLAAVRDTLIRGATFGQVVGDLLVLAALGTAGVILGVLFVRRAESLAKRFGWLHTF